MLGRSELEIPTINQNLESKPDEGEEISSIEFDFLHNAVFTKPEMLETLTNYNSYTIGLLFTTPNEKGIYLASLLEKAIPKFIMLINKTSVKFANTILEKQKLTTIQLAHTILRADDLNEIEKKLLTKLHPKKPDIILRDVLLANITSEEKIQILNKLSEETFNKLLSQPITSNGNSILHVIKKSNELLRYVSQRASQSALKKGVQYLNIKKENFLDNFFGSFNHDRDFALLCSILEDAQLSTNELIELFITPNSCSVTLFHYAYASINCYPESTAKIKEIVDHHFSQLTQAQMIKTITLTDQYDGRSILHSIRDISLLEIIYKKAGSLVFNQAMTIRGGTIFKDASPKTPLDILLEGENLTAAKFILSQIQSDTVSKMVNDPKSKTAFFIFNSLDIKVLELFLKLVNTSALFESLTRNYLASKYLNLNFTDHTFMTLLNKFPEQFKNWLCETKINYYSENMSLLLSYVFYKPSNVINFIDQFYMLKSTYKYKRAWLEIFDFNIKHFKKLEDKSAINKLLAATYHLHLTNGDLEDALDTFEEITDFSSLSKDIHFEIINLYHTKLLELQNYRLVDIHDAMYFGILDKLVMHTKVCEFDMQSKFKKTLPATTPADSAIKLCNSILSSHYKVEYKSDELIINKQLLKKHDDFRNEHFNPSCPLKTFKTLLSTLLHIIIKHKNLPYKTSTLFNRNHFDQETLIYTKLKFATSDKERLDLMKTGINASTHRDFNEVLVAYEEQIRKECKAGLVEKRAGIRGPI